jgi:hypothetical protein
MTFKETMVKAMTSRGMFPNQAMDVINKYIEENKDDSMIGRWNEDVSEYPQNLQAILWMGVKAYAYKWIASNVPEAWFRPMFQYSEKELTQMIK